MSDAVSRRDALKQLGVAGAGLMLGGKIIRGRAGAITIAGQPVEIAVASLSDSTVRITIRPVQGDATVPLPVTGALASDAPAKSVAGGRDASAVARVPCVDSRYPP